MCNLLNVLEVVYSLILPLVFAIVATIYVLSAVELKSKKETQRSKF